jgi:hypothetical protein
VPGSGDFWHWWLLWQGRDFLEMNAGEPAVGRASLNGKTTNLSGFSFLVHGAIDDGEGKI